MKQIVKATLALTVGAMIVTGCTSDDLTDIVTGGDSGSSSMNDKITFSGGTGNFTVTWKKEYNAYGEVVAGTKAMAHDNGAKTITITCSENNSGGQDLSYRCERSNLSGSTAYTSFSLNEGSTSAWSVTYKETAAGSGYDTVEGATQFTLINSNGTLIQQ